MAGIVAYGSYVPFYRLSRSEIGKAWGKSGGAGEKAIAGSDEDSITLATEAALACLKGIDHHEVDSLYFASTRPPYAQKQSASIISAACNLREDISSMDFGHSIRAGSNALLAAIHAVKGGSIKKALVTVAECQVPPGDSADELALGDGAAALIIGDTDIVATIEHIYCGTSEFLDTWRLPQDLYNQTWEDRFVHDMGYLRILKGAVSEAVRRYNLDLKSFYKVIYNAPNDRYHKTIAKTLKLDEKSQVQNPLYSEIGNTAAASTLMMLTAALGDARPDDKILLINYGDGVDIFILAVTPGVEKIKGKNGLMSWLNSKMMVPYGKYLHLRNLMQWETDRRPAPRTSLPILFRESKGLMRLLGKRCQTCGHEQFPRTRICMWCQADLGTTAAYDDVWLARQTGRLFSYNLDLRADTPDLPNVNCVVDLEGGARFYGLMTDRDPEKLQIGLPMEFTFRRINDAQGVHNYFWKVRPIRE